MPLKDSEAIVLRSYKLGERDEIVVFFTRKFGKVRGVARASRRLTSRFGSCLEPLSCVRLSFYEKEGADLVRIRQCDLVRSAFQLQSTPEGLLHLSYLGELLLEFSREGEADDRLFRLMNSVLEAFALPVQNGRSWALLSRYFEIWLLKLEGFLPNFEQCGVCGKAARKLYLSTVDGSVQCDGCGRTGRIGVGSGVPELVRLALGHAPAHFVSQAVEPAPLRELEQINQRLIQLHLEKPLKSYRVLKEMWNPDPSTKARGQ
ncbi:MAG: DNA repair protein RecO [Acidobacteria bacterium]|nr:DNA repair protein RecO [Acidobacteriota bacterium]